MLKLAGIFQTRTCLLRLGEVRYQLAVLDGVAAVNAAYGALDALLVVGERQQIAVADRAGSLAVASPTGALGIVVVKDDSLGDVLAHLGHTRHHGLVADNVVKGHRAPVFICIYNVDAHSHRQSVHGGKCEYDPIAGHRAAYGEEGGYALFETAHIGKCGRILAGGEAFFYSDLAKAQVVAGAEAVAYGAIGACGAGLKGRAADDEAVRFHYSVVEDMDVILEVTLAAFAHAHADDAADTAGAVLDVEIVYADEAYFMSGFLTGHESLLDHDLTVAHFAAERES